MSIKIAEMSKNQNTFIKKQKAELKKRKKREKQEKMAARKDQPKSGDLDDMIQGKKGVNAVNVKVAK